MPAAAPGSFTAFHGRRLIAAGSLGDMALAVKSASEAGTDEPLLVFDDATGAVVDLELRGTREEIVARYAERREGTTPAAPHGQPAEFRGRGRPKLGVVAREVTLLPRHWDWLSAQPGGASAALRRLVDDARRADGERTTQRAARCGLSFHVGDGWRPAVFRGGVTRVVRRRRRTLFATDCAMAERCPRLHRDSRVRRNTDTSIDETSMTRRRRVEVVHSEQDIVDLAEERRPRHCR